MSQDFDRASEEYESRCERQEEEENEKYLEWTEELDRQNELFNKLMKDEEMENVTKINVYPTASGAFRAEVD